ncbi:hypothetical protein DFH09DRAFT_935774, partial [Mycena vulgaris]
IGSHGHISAIRHHYESSSQDAKFSVEPGSADDLAKIMEVIKEHSVSFAVKGGGHATNPTFSSTSGIQISMSRFTKISHDSDKHELTVGAGCVFDEIYKVIRAAKYNIVGGGGSVGIGGWIMGGGYSLKTNQYGLGIDNLVQVQIVLPAGGDGGVVTASENEKSDLFWAIKGGGNNFGIATEFVMETHSQGDGYGGLLIFNKARIERVKLAIINFTSRRDPKAAIVTAFRFYRNHGIHEFKFTVLAFYDDKFDKEPESNPFKDFLAIPHHGRLANSSYTKLNAAATLLYNHIPTDYTQNLINVVEEEAKVNRLTVTSYLLMIVAEVWPFLPTMFDKSVDSAWPHKKDTPNGPLLVYFMWEGRENDEVWINQMKTALNHIHSIAILEGCTTKNAPVYCNTTLEDVTTLPQIYRGNLRDLSALRTKYDPGNVMKRTGGFRIPFGPAVDKGSYKINNKLTAIGAQTLPGPITVNNTTEVCGFSFSAIE